ncbi:hypothetical protein ECC02_007436 [Trypanosoma cruzi]|uniref:RNase H n=1 Tax=Trypanosoma cruzi TaxID=5693 RepID=A0A7J6XYU5_TRYCR|nr:hypothetical protein ECC02_007436 [Trypanosoma cruzi]
MQLQDGIPRTVSGPAKADYPSHPTQAQTLLVVTDSQSLLAALNKGPLSQTGWTEDQIWQRLLTLTCAGWSVHLQFCYGHRGVHVNESADQHATQNTATGQYTQNEIAPIWHTEVLTCINTQPTKAWRSTIRQDTHCHYLLGGARPSDPGGKHLITQEALDRQERLQRARAGCGKSELWGRLYWTVRLHEPTPFLQHLTGTVCLYALQQRSNCTRDGRCSPDDKG